jgi:calcium binding protein 39
MNFFKTKQRTPPDLVRGLRDAIPKLETGPPGGETRRRAAEDVSKNLQQIKSILYGDGGRRYASDLSSTCLMG